MNIKDGGRLVISRSDETSSAWPISGTDKDRERALGELASAASRGEHRALEDALAIEGRSSWTEHLLALMPSDKTPAELWRMPREFVDVLEGALREIDSDDDLSQIIRVLVHEDSHYARRIRRILADAVSEARAPKLPANVLQAYLEVARAEIAAFPAARNHSR